MLRNLLQRLPPEAKTNTSTSQANGDEIVSASIFPPVPTFEPSTRRSTVRSRRWSILSRWRGKRQQRSHDGAAPTSEECISPPPAQLTSSQPVDPTADNEEGPNTACTQACTTPSELHTSIRSLELPQVLLSNGEQSAPSQASLTAATSVGSSAAAEKPAPCSVVCSIASSQVTVFKKYSTRILCIGDPIQVHLPGHVTERWERVTRDQLRIDLGDVISEIRRREATRRKKPSEHACNVTYELRMSGYAPKGSGSVTLSPCIWVLCGSKWACTTIRKAVKDYTWITAFAPVEVHVGGAVFANTVVAAPIMQNLDFSHGLLLRNGCALFINVQDYKEGSSVCGLVCCATLKRGDSITHYTSRIGGLVSLEMKQGSTLVCGISTAHGILDLVMASQLDECSDNESISTLNSVDTIMWDRADEEQTDDENENPGATPKSTKNSLTQRLGYVDPAAITEWRNHSCGASMSFSGQSIASPSLASLGFEPDLGCRAQLVQAFSAPTISARTDHMLMCFGGQSHSQVWSANTYSGGGSGGGESPTTILRHLKDSDLVEGGAVSILYGQGDSVSGNLIAGSTSFVAQGTTLTLRKIRTPQIMANGVSGSWVVRGDALCGMIIAIFETEPYALMMTAERLFTNVEEANPAITTASVERSNPPHQPLSQSEDIDSMFSLRDAASFSSCNSTGSDASSSQTSVVFGFDSVLLSSGVYERCFQGSVKENLRSQQLDEPPSSQHRRTCRVRKSNNTAKPKLAMRWLHTTLEQEADLSASSGGILSPIRKKRLQRVRRWCHSCGAMFPFGTKACESCGHRRCTDCARVPSNLSMYPYGYPGDEFGPSAVPHFECHECKAVFPSDPAPETQCSICLHKRCDKCPRLKPHRVEPSPDPEILENVAERLKLLGVS